MGDRFVAQVPPEFIRRFFTTNGDLFNLDPNWNVAPAQPAIVIRRQLERRPDWSFATQQSKGRRIYTCFVFPEAVTSPCTSNRHNHLE